MKLTNMIILAMAMTTLSAFGSDKIKISCSGDYKLDKSSSSSSEKTYTCKSKSKTTEYSTKSTKCSSGYKISYRNGKDKCVKEVIENPECKQKVLQKHFDLKRTTGKDYCENSKGKTHSDFKSCNGDYVVDSKGNKDKCVREDEKNPTCASGYSYDKDIDTTNGSKYIDRCRKKLSKDYDYKRPSVTNL